MTSSRKGLGVLELTVLDVLASIGAGVDGPYVRTSRVLERLDASAGIGARIGYEFLCDLAGWWRISQRLVDFHGNGGSLDFGPAHPRYTEVRLSAAGSAALDAERGDAGPMPFGLVVGTSWTGGLRPPFDGGAVVEALRQLRSAPSLDDDAVNEIVGPPVFPTHCTIEGDLQSLVRGDPIDLVLGPRIEPEPGTDLATVVITGLPPDSSLSDVASMMHDALVRRSPGLPHLKTLSDESRQGQIRFKVVGNVGTTVDEIIESLSKLWLLRRPFPFLLAEPLATTVRRWAELVTDASLERFSAALEQRS